MRKYLQTNMRRGREMRFDERLENGDVEELCTYLRASIESSR